MPRPIVTVMDSTTATAGLAATPGPPRDPHANLGPNLVTEPPEMGPEPLGVTTFEPTNRPIPAPKRSTANIGRKHGEK